MAYFDWFLQHRDKRLKDIETAAQRAIELSTQLALANREFELAKRKQEFSEEKFAKQFELNRANYELGKESLLIQKGRLAVDRMYKEQMLELERERLRINKMNNDFLRMSKEETQYQIRMAQFVNQYVNARQKQIAEGKLTYNKVVEEAKARFRKEFGPSPIEKMAIKKESAPQPTSAGHDVESVKTAAVEEAKKKLAWKWPSITEVNGRIVARGAKYGFKPYAGLADGRERWFKMFSSQLNFLAGAINKKKVLKELKFANEFVNDVKKSPSLIYRLEMLLDEMKYDGDKTAIINAVKEAAFGSVEKANKLLGKSKISTEARIAGVGSETVKTRGDGVIKISLPDSAITADERQKLKDKEERKRIIDAIDRQSQEIAAMAQRIGMPESEIKPLLERWIDIQMEGLTIDKEKDKKRYVDWLTRKAQIESQIYDIKQLVEVKQSAESGNYKFAVSEYAKTVGVDYNTAVKEIEEMRTAYGGKYVSDALEILNMAGALSADEAKYAESGVNNYDELPDALKAKVDRMFVRMKMTSTAATLLTKNGAISDTVGSNSSRKKVNKFIDMQKDIFDLMDEVSKNQTGWTYNDRIVNLYLNHGHEVASWLKDKLVSGDIDVSILYTFLKNQILTVSNIYANKMTFVADFSDKRIKVLESIKSIYKKVLESVTDEKQRQYIDRIGRALERIMYASDEKAMQKYIEQLDDLRWGE